MLIICIPVRTAFNQLHHIKSARMTGEEAEEVNRYGMKHLEFCMELYQIQIDGGLYFLHEDPDSASSWGREISQRNPLPA